MRYNESYLNNEKGKCLLKTFYSTVSEGKRIYREHHHVESEISTFLSGSGIYTVGNREYEFNKGDVFIFSGNENHCITKITQKFELLNIHFIPTFLFSGSDDFSLFKIFYSKNNNFTNKIDVNNQFTKDIHRSIISISDELMSKRDGYKSMIKSYLYFILVTLIRNYNYVNNQSDLNSYTLLAKTIQKAMTYIDENLTNELTLSKISEKINMTPSYFSTVFKKLNGISPWEYIITKRIEKAIDMLNNSDTTKIDIAMRCGFKSSSNFYKHFTKVTGKKPSDYIK